MVTAPIPSASPCGASSQSLREATLHRSRVLTAVAACLLVLVAGCSSGGQSQPPSSSLHGGNLVFDFATAPLDLDPSTSGDNATSMQMWNAWFQYLVQPNSPGPGYAPMLAASYSISADQLVYTFRIRPGVKFSDGRLLTAADVVYSLKRNIHPSISLLNFLNGYISAITAPAVNTVLIKLKRPSPNLLADLASPTAAIYPLRSFTDRTAASFFTRHPVGTGPFRLVSEAPNTTYVVARNPHYWDKAAAPKLAKITFQIVTDDTARATAVSADRRTSRSRRRERSAVVTGVRAAIGLRPPGPSPTA